MNKYEILGIVGEGAYGVVYKAKNKEYISLYNKEYYRKHKAKKQEYYQNNYDKVRQQWRLYKLKTKLLKILFITLYPHLLLNKDVSPNSQILGPTQIQTIST